MKQCRSKHAIATINFDYFIWGEDIPTWFTFVLDREKPVYFIKDNVLFNRNNFEKPKHKGLLIPTFPSKTTILEVPSGTYLVGICGHVLRFTKEEFNMEFIEVLP